MLLGWYDREVAAAVFEPVRAQMEQADNEDLAAVANPLQGWPTPFLGWSIFDPLRRGGPARASACDRRDLGPRSLQQPSAGSPDPRAFLQGSMATDLDRLHGYEIPARARHPVIPVAVSDAMLRGLMVDDQVPAPIDTDRGFGASFDREAGATCGGWTRFRKPGAYNYTARHAVECAE